MFDLALGRLAIRTLPLGTAYAIWTGIGAVGTVIVGILIFREPADAARLICVGVPMQVMRRRFGFEFTPHAVKIMTWGGLRGGISVALALALPPVPERQVVLVLTYIVVLFSILVQGLTVGPLIRRTLPAAGE